MLAAFAVTSLDDAPVTMAGDAPGTLRQAIFDANTAPGPDTIDFQSGLSGAISLTAGEMEITEAVEINGSSKALLTIDAENNSRIFDFTNATGDLTIRDLTLTRGSTSGNNVEIGDFTYSGGAIRSLSSGTVSLFSSTISNSSTAGRAADGGAISAAGAVTLNFSTITGNSTLRFKARGGGISAFGDVTLNASTVSNNATRSNAADGGGIFSYANVTVSNSTIVGNSTNKMSADGGGISARMDVIVNSSTISGNSTWDDGGGIWSYRDVFVTDSIISNNETVDFDTAGGGIGAGRNVTVTSSTISGNTTTDDGGGGIYAGFLITIYSSTVSGNSAIYSGMSEKGQFAEGGGVRSKRHITVNNSTISGNWTTGQFARGGGMAAGRNVTVSHSTVTGNWTTGTAAGGGGIAATGDFIDQGNPTMSNLIIDHSIIAGNTTVRVSPDLLSDNDTVSITHSLIGDNSDTTLTEAQTPDIDGNLIGQPASNAGSGIVDPLLLPLANNGGTTQTHALLPHSPAVDRGDPEFTTPPGFDQRGINYVRLADGDGDSMATVDIGAFETQLLPSADFDSDMDIDGSDFLAWQRGFGIVGGAIPAAGDADRDGDVDASDLFYWEADFGSNAEVVPATAVSSNSHSDTTVQPSLQPDSGVIDSLSSNQAIQFTPHRFGNVETMFLRESDQWKSVGTDVRDGLFANSVDSKQRLGVAATLDRDDSEITSQQALADTVFSLLTGDELRFDRMLL